MTLPFYYEVKRGETWTPCRSSTKPHSKCHPVGERIWRETRNYREVPPHLDHLSLTQLRDLSDSLPKVTG